MSLVKVERYGLATVLCAVLSGVAAEEIGELSHEDLRRLSTNSTGDALEIEVVVAAVLGGLAVLILLVGAVWYSCLRPARAGAGAGAGGFASSNPSLQPFGFTSSANPNDLGGATELPNLRMWL